MWQRPTSNTQDSREDQINGWNLLILQGEIMAEEIRIAALIKKKYDELTTKVSVSYGPVSLKKINMPIARKCLLTN